MGIYTPEQLDECAFLDLQSDARGARLQANNGPFYPGVTRESLLAYAEKCEAQIAKYRDGGAHAAVLRCEGFAGLVKKDIG